MRLINVETLELETFVAKDETPRYAVLSHTWGDADEELTIDDFRRGLQHGGLKPGIGAEKLRGCRHQARQDRVPYLWIDTCCIDKSNLTELTEAINSMYGYYQGARRCYVYLSDVATVRDAASGGFEASRWFTRGWTLQELIAPREKLTAGPQDGRVQFFTADWELLGTKVSLCSRISTVTKIPVEHLLCILDPDAASIAQRMAWVSGRSTTREEDMAYCLLGLFGVSMPMLYGEGLPRAFLRLQREILQSTTDDSILAWGLRETYGPDYITARLATGTVLAQTPEDFAGCEIIVSRPQLSDQPLEYSGGKLRIVAPLLRRPDGQSACILSCGPQDDSTKRVGIPLMPNRKSVPRNEYGRASSKRPGFWLFRDGALPVETINVHNHGQYPLAERARRIYRVIDESGHKFEVAAKRPGGVGFWGPTFILTREDARESNGSKRTFRFVAGLRGEFLEDSTGLDSDHQDSGAGEEPFDLILFIETEVEGEEHVRSRCHAMVCSTKDGLEEAQKDHRRLVPKNTCPIAVTDRFSVGVRLEQGVRMTVIRIVPAQRRRTVAVNATAYWEEDNGHRRNIRILAARPLRDAERARAAAALRWLPLHLDEGKLTSLIELNPSIVNDADISGRSAISWAAGKGDVDFLKKMAASPDADLDSRDKDGRSPLSWAAAHGHLDVCKFLIAGGRIQRITKDAEDKDGLTPLAWALSRGHDDVAQELLHSHSWGDPPEISLPDVMKYIVRESMPEWSYPWEIKRVMPDSAPTIKPKDGYFEISRGSDAGTWNWTFLTIKHSFPVLSGIIISVDVGFDVVNDADPFDLIFPTGIDLQCKGNQFAWCDTSYLRNKLADSTVCAGSIEPCRFTMLIRSDVVVIAENGHVVVVWRPEEPITMLEPAFVPTIMKGRTAIEVTISNLFIAQTSFRSRMNSPFDLTGWDMEDGYPLPAANEGPVLARDPKGGLSISAALDTRKIPGRGVLIFRFRILDISRLRRITIANFLALQPDATGRALQWKYVDNMETRDFVLCRRYSEEPYWEGAVQQGRVTDFASGLGVGEDWATVMLVYSEYAVALFENNTAVLSIRKLADRANVQLEFTAELVGENVADVRKDGAPSRPDAGREPVQLSHVRCLPGFVGWNVWGGS